MPLHGKVVVIKRSGGDGTEFPLTASCLFGRKPDCDIRIQLPQVSKEHCRIDLNENKEIILTNLSSVNPTCVNGQALQQSERLKHGDVITIIDRSFRFEYPPAPTPKKRSSVGGKAEAVASDPHLKDGANIHNIQRSLEKTLEVESKEDVSLSESKTASPFNELYQMIKKSLDVKTPRKSSVSVLQTPSSKFCTPKPESARKDDTKPVRVGGKSMTKKEQTPVRATGKVQTEDGSLCLTPKSTKRRRSLQLPTEQTPNAEETTQAETSSPRCKATPQKFTVSEAVEQIATQTPKSPTRRRSKETTSPKSEPKQVVSPAKTDKTHKATPKSSETAKEKPKKRKSEELAADLPTQQMKRKRVSFGGQLSPELFDKRLPPDSPLRKGAAPRRSLCLSRPKLSLLRRASVIGLLKEGAQEGRLVKSPKARTPSPKKSPNAKNASPKTPTPAKKSPKAQSPAQRASPKNKSPSPKTPSPGKKAVTPKSASPKSVKTPAKSPQTPKATSQRKSSPKMKSPAHVIPVKTPLPAEDQTPTVQGRFSVSRISTPSPVVKDAVSEHVPSVNVTPKIPLQRKSMKSSAKKTPALKSAAKVMRRKSGLMRSSMKVMTSWADIVRFGKAKVQVAVPTKKQVTKKTTKKQTVKTPKKMPQTPLRKLVDHVSTGHAASPATIVVGRAHRLRVVQATGAPPKVVTNAAVLIKNIKMDEDFTGISEMFKTPKNDKRRSVKTMHSATKTPPADVKSIIEPSVLNTPEETGEMVVSPMSVASTVKGKRYNSEAVQRLLNQQESTFVSDIPPLEIESEPTAQESTELTTDTPTTPKSNIEKPGVLTGVKRIMKTPKQKAEPVEDLRGKLLKTPKQKMEQEECLSAIKRIMKTPKEKGTPVEDLRSKILKTPKQKIEQNEECLSGVKRIMKTPKEKAVPVKDLRGRLLKTPKQKIEQQEECLSGVKMMMQTPNQKIEQPECPTVVKRVMRTPRPKSEPIEDLRGKPLQTPKQKIEQQDCLTGVERIMTTPKQKTEEEVDVEEILPAVKRIPRTPKEKAQPVEDQFGIKKLMRSPRLRGNAPVEDFEGLEELMREQPVEDQTCVATEESVVDQSDSRSKDMDFVETIPKSAPEVQNEAEMVIASNSETKPVAESIEEGKDKSEVEVPVRGRRGREVEPVKEGAPEPVVKPRRGRKAKAVAHEEVTLTPVSDATPDDDEAKESTETMPSISQEDDSNAMQTCEPVEVETAAATEITEAQKKPVRSRRKAVEAQVAHEEKEDIPAAVEDKKDEEVLECAAPVRGRRGKRTTVKEPEEPVQEESAPEPVVKPRRGRISKKSSQEKDEVQEVSTEMVPEAESPVNNVVESAPAHEHVVKPRRGRIAKKASQNEDKVVQAVCTETVPEAENAANDVESAPTQECVVKPRRGRKAKVVEPELVTPAPVSDATQANEAKESTETIQSVNQEEDSVVVEPVVAESAPEVGTVAAIETIEACISEAQKKPVRGRRKAVATKAVHEEKEDIPSAIEDKNKVSEEAAPVRHRRGKRTEAPLAPSVRQRRGRAGKAQEMTSEEATITPPEEANQVNETAPEQADNHTTAVTDCDHTETAVLEKPKRGRKNNNKPAEPQPEPESTVIESEQTVVEESQTTADAQPEQHVPEKPKRGKRAKTQVEPPQPEPESTAVVSEQPVEDTQTEQPVTEKPKRGRNTRAATEVPQASVRGTRGRTTKLEVKSPEPKKVQRAKKAESHQDESSEEVQTTEAAEETPVEAVKSDEQACPAPKSRRGAQKTQDAQNGTLEEASEKVSVSSSTDKPKRGKRGTQVLEVNTSEVQGPEDDSAVKPSRARGKMSAKHVPDTVPAKKARRGAAVSVEESAAEEVTEVEPVKKGRRAASKAPAEETVSSNQNNSTEQSEAVEDTKASKRAVQWKTDLEIFEVTPVKKTARGRKTKSGDQKENENGVPQKATNPEEKDLSDKEVQPAKRARRGAKAADVATKTNVDDAEAETQPKTRRGRAAKK